MNIAFLTWADSWHIPVKTKYFVERGHKVFYFGIYPGTGQDIKPKGVKFVPINSEKKNKYLALIDKIAKVSRLSGEYKIDIMHAVDMSNAIYAVFSKAKRLVIENNGSDVLVRPKKGIKLRFIYPIFYRFADAVTQDSYVTREAGLKYGAPKKNNEIIELGIDFKIFNQSVPKGEGRKKLGIKGDEKIVFSPRGLTPLYNVYIIIKTIPAVKKVYPGVKYVFCRHFGASWDEYGPLVSSLGVEENIVFAGFLDNEKDMPYIYRDSDVVVSVPSSDSSPRSVYEAMAVGAPVIASELPWYHGKFEKDKDMTVVPVKDVPKLAEAIIDNLKRVDPVRIESARKKVKEKIDANVHNKKLEELYERILCRP